MQEEEALAYREHFYEQAKEYYQNFRQVIRSPGRGTNQGPLLRRSVYNYLNKYINI
jgi:hypothetical protein